jgi:hypothetical protein
MAKEKVNIFSRPEEIDAVIKSKIAQFSVKGGKLKNNLIKWSEEELELRDAVILDYITVDGLSRERTAHQIADRWDIGLSTGRKYVQEAVERFCKNQVEESEDTIRKMMEEKLLAIFQDANDAKDRTNSLKALDLLGKMYGTYKEKSDVNVNLDGNISFDFGNNQ